MSNLLKDAYDHDRFRETGHQLIEILADHLHRSHDGNNFHTLNWKSPDEQLDYWKADFQKPPVSSPNELFNAIIENSVNLHSPGYLGHQVSPALPLTALTSTLMSFLNNGMAVYEMGMAGNAMEKVITDYLAAKFGLGEQSSGIVTSGGTLGNLTALLAARASVTNIWEDGAADHQSLAVLVSAEAHYSIDRAARIMGIGESGIIKVPVDTRYRMRTDLLETCYNEAVNEGKKVTCVVGCACSTSTGAYDDLQAIAEFASARNIWFHVDGAHGAPAIFSDKHKYLLNGIDKADSIVVDFHKMMMAPSLSTALLFKNGRVAANTFSQKALYIYQERSDEEWFNSGKYTFECTKPATIFHTYTIMRLFGDELYRQNVDTLFKLAQDFATLIKNHDQFELACEPQANIVCFRYKCADEVEGLNKEALRQLIQTGKFYIVSTYVNDEYYLRVSIMNPFTNIANLELLLVDIQEIAFQIQDILTNHIKL